MVEQGVLVLILGDFVIEALLQIGDGLPDFFQGGDWDGLRFVLFWQTLRSLDGLRRLRWFHRLR